MTDRTLLDVSHLATVNLLWDIGVESTPGEPDVVLVRCYAVDGQPDADGMIEPVAVDALEPEQAGALAGMLIHAARHAAAANIDPATADQPPAGETSG